MDLKELINELKYLAETQKVSRREWLEKSGIKNTYFSTITNSPALSSFSKYEALAEALGYRLVVSFALEPMDKTEKDVLQTNARPVADVEPIKE